MRSTLGVVVAFAILMPAGGSSAGEPAMWITWEPVQPEIGETVVFVVGGVAGIQEARWDFGGQGCGFFSQQYSCQPGPFGDCTMAPFKFASGGMHDVTLAVEATSGHYSAEATVDVQPTGWCCAYAIDPSSSGASNSGGSGNVAVITDAGCDWTATSNVIWAGITAGTPGSGPGSVHYEIAPNAGPPRVGTLTVAYRTFTLYQPIDGVFSDGFESGDADAWSATVQ